MLPPVQIPIATALVVFSQTFAGALFLGIPNAIFDNSVKTLISEYAPAVNPQVIINAGATGFRTATQPSELPSVLVAYAKRVDRVFYLTTGVAAGFFLFSLGMGWKDIRKRNQVSAA